MGNLVGDSPYPEPGHDAERGRRGEPGGRCNLSATDAQLNLAQGGSGNAQLHIDAAINDLSQSRSSSGHGLLTQSTAGKGKVEQTLQYTTIDVPGASQAGGPVQLQATGGIAVGASSLSPAGSTASGGTGVPTITVDLKQQAQQLASQPGLAYQLCGGSGDLYRVCR